MVKKFMQNWGRRITAIPIICNEGIIDIGMYAGNVNAVTFLNFVTDKLCPNLVTTDRRQFILFYLFYFSPFFCFYLHICVLVRTSGHMIVM